MNNKIKSNFAVAVAVFVLLLASLNFVSADGLVPCDECGLCDLARGVNDVVKFLITSVALPLAGVAIIYAGIMILTAGAAPKNIDKGKAALWSAVWGLFIALAAMMLIDMVFKLLLVGGDGYIQDWGPWNTIKGC